MAFLKLIRIDNLLGIVFAMCGVHVAITMTNPEIFLKFNLFDFSLLVFSTVMIAAAGNAINDYFDMRADRVNKPDKIVLGNKIKKRWAIVIHWGFNLVSAVISIYLSYKYSTWFYLFIHVFSSTLLWTYSVYLKKKLYIGNLSIAILTFLVPLLVVYFYKSSNEFAMGFNSYQAQTWSTYGEYSLVYLFSFLALVGNLSREIIKDIEDIKGDLAVGVYSIPIAIGEKKAGYLSIIIACLMPVVMAFYWASGYMPHSLIFNAMMVLVAITPLMVWYFLNLKQTKRASLMLKISMFIGFSALFLTQT